MSYENFVSCWLLCLKFQLCGTDIYESPFVASYWLYLSLHFLHIIRNDLSSRPRFKATLHFHPVYLLPCRPERIIAGSLQSPVYLRLRLRLPTLIWNKGSAYLRQFPLSFVYYWFSSWSLIPRSAGMPGIPALCVLLETYNRFPSHFVWSAFSFNSWKSIIIVCFVV